MARELTPAELRDLLAVYAIDAVDGDEREQVDAFLRRAPEAAREVAELREAVALLSYAGPDDAPEGLWERIEGALDVEPPRLDLGEVLELHAPGREQPSREPRRPRRGIAARVAIGIAAASAVAAGVTAFVVSDEMSRQDERLDEVAASVEHDRTERAAQAALADPSARTVPLAGTRGEAGGMVVTLPDGRSYLMAHDVPRLEAGRTYQLWAVTGEETAPRMVSAALLGRSVEAVAFRAPDDVLGFMVTEEDAPGAVEMRGTPVLEGHVA